MEAAKRFAPIDAKLPRLIHGAHYNPDQSTDDPAILDEDMLLMKLAGKNAATVCIPGRADPEPRGGGFELSWLERSLEGTRSIERALDVDLPRGDRNLEKQ